MRVYIKPQKCLIILGTASDMTTVPYLSSVYFGAGSFLGFTYARLATMLDLSTSSPISQSHGVNAINLFSSSPML